jgi:hypothetical protein
MQPAPAALEETLAERRLERVDLSAQRRGREVQALGGPRHGALARHHPDVAQVLEVQAVHERHHTSVIPTYSIETS